MKCVQGDIAIITKCSNGTEGKIVRCVARTDLNDAWIIDPIVIAADGSIITHVQDSQLSPLLECY